MCCGARARARLLKKALIGESDAPGEAPPGTGDNRNRFEVSKPQARRGKMCRRGWRVCIYTESKAENFAS